NPMNDHLEREPEVLNGTPAQQPTETPAPAANGTPEVLADPVPETPEEAATWHAEAGRKGARRIHELIQRGLLYGQEQGLKRGRQRLRQLIEEGKLYEEEHNLRARRRRTQADQFDRMDSDELVQTFLRSLLRLCKPVYREKIARALQALEEATGGDN